MVMQVNHQFFTLHLVWNNYGNFQNLPSKDKHWSFLRIFEIICRNKIHTKILETWLAGHEDVSTWLPRSPPRGYSAQGCSGIRKHYSGSLLLSLSSLFLLLSLSLLLVLFLTFLSHLYSSVLSLLSFLLLRISHKASLLLYRRSFFKKNTVSCAIQ